jgi:hypothetical protein
MTGNADYALQRGKPRETGNMLAPYLRLLRTKRSNGKCGGQPMAKNWMDKVIETKQKAVTVRYDFKRGQVITFVMTPFLSSLKKGTRYKVENLEFGRVTFLDLETGATISERTSALVSMCWQVQPKQ